MASFQVNGRTGSSSNDRIPFAQGNSDGKFLALTSIMSHHAVNMAIKATLDLGIPDILFKAGGKKLTAEEIVEQLPVKSRDAGSDSVRRLVCILRPLVWEGVFTKSLNDKKQPVYGLTEAANWFLKESELNILAISEFSYREDILDCSLGLSKAVLDDAITPFEEAHGVPMYEYPKKQPDFGGVFGALMASWSNLERATVMENLQSHALLDGVDTLVDVGGNAGSNLAEIIANNPHVKGINFDLPQVIAEAPEREGVTNIGGNMFETVPPGDAMFAKWILHNYDDEHSVVILKNCFNALPSKNGKMIILEYVLLDDDGQDDVGKSLKDKFAYTMDIHMLSMLKGARERTKVQYEQLLTAAGFSRSEFILNPGAIDVIVAFKE